MYKAYLTVACCTWDLCAYHILSLTVYIRIISCPCAVVVVMPKWPFITMSISLTPRNTGSPESQPISIGRATPPRPTHTAALAAPAMEGVPAPNSGSVGHRKALSLGRVDRSTSVFGNLICVVSLPHEDEWMPNGATIRQPRVDDEEESTLFSWHITCLHNSEQKIPNP